MESMHQIVVQIAKVQLLKVPFAVKRLKVHCPQSAATQNAATQSAATHSAATHSAVKRPKTL